MPHSAPRPCGTPGCPELVRGAARCVKHERAAQAHRRETVGNPYNNPRWRALRQRQLSAAPLCAHCAAAGVVTAATVCDHIEPHRGDQVKFWAGPFQSLCATCHNRKTAVEDGGFGNPVVRR